MKDKERRDTQDRAGRPVIRCGGEAESERRDERKKGRQGRREGHARIYTPRRGKGRNGKRRGGGGRGERHAGDR